MDNIIYAVKVTNLCGKHPVSKISQDTYDSYEKVNDFIRRRSDNPVKTSYYEWESKEYRYNIIILNVE